MHVGANVIVPRGESRDHRPAHTRDFRNCDLGQDGNPPTRATRPIGSVPRVSGLTRFETRLKL